MPRVVKKGIDSAGFLRVRRSLRTSAPPTAQCARRSTCAPFRFRAPRQMGLDGQMGWESTCPRLHGVRRALCLRLGLRDGHRPLNRVLGLSSAKLPNPAHTLKTMVETIVCWYCGLESFQGFLAIHSIKEATTMTRGTFHHDTPGGPR